MLDPAYIREHLAEVEARLRSRGPDPSRELSEFSALETERRRLLPLVENLKRQQNAAGEAVARAKREERDPSALFAESKLRAGEIKEQEARLNELERQRTALLQLLPNLPHESVPVGKSPADNAEVRRWGSLPTFDFQPKPHWELGTALGILDFERATRMSGARFSVLLGAGRQARAGAHQLHARSAHARARVPRGRAAVSRQPRGALPAPAICRSSRRTCSRWRASGICSSSRPRRCR